MTDNKQAILNGIATTSIYDMLRKGQTFKLPSVLANFIASDGWKAVEYINPDNNLKAVISFDCFTDWVMGSPARGGLGSQVHVIAEYVTQPMDVDAAPDCTVKLAKAEPALLPKLLKVAQANQETLGGPWTKVVGELTNLQGSSQGRRTDLLDSVQEVKAPTGNSAAAGLRKLRRYAESDSLCDQYDIKQDDVTEQYGKTLRGEKSVHRALIDCGLKKVKTAAAGLGVDGPPDDVARRIIKRLGKDRAALLVTELSALLSQ